MNKKPTKRCKWNRHEKTRLLGTGISATVDREPFETWECSVCGHEFIVLTDPETAERRGRVVDFFRMLNEVLASMTDEERQRAIEFLDRVHGVGTKEPPDATE